MKLTDFDFDLPQELIAQAPSDKRDHSDLLIAGKDSESNKIVKFYNIIDQLNKGDVIVFNNSRVINAKLELPGNININLNRPIGGNKWLGFARPAKKLQENDIFEFDEHQIIINKKLDYGEIELEFKTRDGLSVFEFLNQYGKVPLPQYIKREKREKNSTDSARYQNVYSKPEGSVAAATAGLHFTGELLDKIRQKNIEVCFVTLHVGAGTFLPVKTENVKDHKMHTEWCEISKESAEIINQAKGVGRRVVAVGTTAMRTLESCASGGMVQSGSRETDIFITPGFDFQIVDSLITNFHLPKSTLFMLICAFAGFDEMHELYQYAIRNKMRFFSYGDSMIINRKK